VASGYPPAPPAQSSVGYPPGQPTPPAGGYPYALPPPPVGPGVRPPFVAPPTDGNRRRLWTGLGTAAAVLVLVCGGGIAGFTALVRGTINERSQAATKAVTSFLTDVRNDDYTGAYRAQCLQLRQRLTLDEFKTDFSGAQLSAFTLGQPEINTDETIVPVALSFIDGGTDNQRFVVIVDSDGASRVCGTE
jgi:hypothetical protein